MKTYTIYDGRVEEGIKIHQNRPDLQPYIQVGEEGRGRKVVRVPVPSGVSQPPKWAYKVRIDKPKVLFPQWAYCETPEQAYECVQKEQDKGNKAVAYDPEVSEPGVLKEAQGSKYLILIKDHSGFRGSCSLGYQDGVNIIAQGFCAQGTAGRMGGGPEYLVLVRPGTMFTIQLTGRLYGKPSNLRVQVSDDIRIMDAQAMDESEQARQRLQQALEEHV